MRIRRLTRAPAFRLAAAQATLFLAVFAASGAFAMIATREVEARAAHAEILQMEDDMTDLLRARGEAALIARLDAPSQDPSRVARYESANGRRLAGVLPSPRRPSRPTSNGRFWSDAATGAWPLGRHVLAYSRPEPGGAWLTVGEDLSSREHKDALGLLLMLGCAGGVAAAGIAIAAETGRRVLRRVDAIARALESYAAGARGTRVPVPAQPRSELDELALSVNAMLLREERLVEGLRQVSTSIAHDLRRPLAHHNQAISAALSRPSSEGDDRAALIEASARVAEVLQTFQSLLQIAELEAGAPGLTPERVDLRTVAERVVGAYTPGAEAEGRRLSLSLAEEPALVLGDSRVLSRMVANLVENALVHTPEGTSVAVAVEASGPRLIVSDDGPGVSAEALPRLLERFFRVDASRSTPGSGLGLALAAATARAFGGHLSAHDAAPGLRIVADFGRT